MRIQSIVTALMGIALTLSPGYAETQGGAGALRIGVFDSRSVALAYYNSQAGQDEAKQLHQAHEEAKAKGDAASVAKLEVMGPVLQQLRHLQVFSSGSIGNVLELPAVRDALPAIAQEAGVAVVVSRWEVAWSAKDAEVVDLTPRLVALFKPSEQVLRWIDQMKEQKPLPLAEALAIRD